MNRSEVITAINVKAQEVFTAATEQYYITFGDVNIDFNMRGRVAGRANKYRLCFNVEIAILNFEVFCNEVVPHEIAHVVCRRHPNLGHGHNHGWQRVCLSLGGSGSTKHDMECNYAHGSFLYRSTGGKEVDVSTVRHNRIQRGTEYRVRGVGRINADGWIRSGITGDAEVGAPIYSKNQASLPMVMMLNAIVSWGSNEQMAAVDRLMKMGNKLVSAKNNIATLTNGSRTVNILTTGQREYM